MTNEIEDLKRRLAESEAARRRTEARLRETEGWHKAAIRERDLMREQMDQILSYEDIETPGPDENVAAVVLAALEHLREARERAEAERDEARRAAICDVCLGDPLPGMRGCICGGTGRLTDAALGLREEMVKADDRATAAESRLRDAVGALRPFAAYWQIKRQMVGTPKCDVMLGVHASLGNAEVTVEDFDRARSALARIGEVPGE